MANNSALHHCIARTNRQLRPGNQQITTHLATDGANGGDVEVPVIATTSTDSLDGPMTVIAKYCPLCGQRLRTDRAGDVDQ